MKKWADLKCDGKRRIAALRGPNGSNLRKKNLGPVERMVHKILMMSPRGDGDSDQDFGDDDDLSKLYTKGLASNTAPYSYLSLADSSHSIPGGASLDLSPLSSPEKELGGDPLHSSSDFDVDLGEEGERTMDLDENDDSVFSSQPSSLPPPSSTSLDPLPDDVLLRVKPVYTYSRNNVQNHNHIQNHNYSRPTPGPSSSVASTSSVLPPLSDLDAASSSAVPPLSQSPPNSNLTGSSNPACSSVAPSLASSLAAVAANDSTSHPLPSSSSIPPPSAPPPVSSAAVSSTSSSSSSSSSSGASATTTPASSAPSASFHQPPTCFSAPPSNLPPTSDSNPSDPLPAGASSRKSQDHVAQMASQSLQQQRASRMLLTSVSQSLEVLAQSVQLLVESQQEFVQESLLLQRETVDILRDFSNTALTMLRDKANSGHLATHHHPPSHPPF